MTGEQVGCDSELLLSLHELLLPVCGVGVGAAQGGPVCGNGPGGRRRQVVLLLVDLGRGPSQAGGC